MDKYHQYFIESSDSTKLFLRSWECAKPKAVIAIVHGIGEHGFRYDNWAKMLVDNGFSVYTVDYRGHGRAEGKRGFVNSFDDLLNDVDAYLKHVSNKHQSVPLVLYGHSLGGNIVINYTLQRKNIHNLLIATSPWLDLHSPLPKPLLAVAKLLHKLFPNLIMNSTIKAKILSHDKQVVKDYEDDEYVHPKVSLNLLFGGIENAQYARNNARNINIPMLLMHGTDDKATLFDASKRFANDNTTNVSFVEWKGLYHELHNEFEKEDVFKSIISWLNKKLLTK